MPNLSEHPTNGRDIAVIAENDVPNEVLIRAAYALLLAADTTHEDLPSAARWHADRETFMVAVQRQILSVNPPGVD